MSGLFLNDIGKFFLGAWIFKMFTGGDDSGCGGCGCFIAVVGIVLGALALKSCF